MSALVRVSQSCFIVYEQENAMTIRKCLQHTNKAETVLKPVRGAPECLPPMSTALIRLLMHASGEETWSPVHCSQ
ncbi:uncharacterized [Tachysurus ichikawai]